MKNGTVRAIDECFVLAILSFGCWVFYFNLSGLLLDATEQIQIALLRVAGQHAAYFGAVVAPTSLLMAIIAGVSVAYLLKRRHLLYSILLASPIVAFSVAYGPPRFRVSFALLTFLLVLAPIAIAGHLAGRALGSQASPLSSQNMASSQKHEPSRIPGAIVLLSNVLILSSAAFIYPTFAKLTGEDLLSAIGGLGAALLGFAVAYELRAMRKRAVVIFVAVVIGLYVAAAVVLEDFPWEAFMRSMPLFLAVVVVLTIYWPRMR